MQTKEPVFCGRCAFFASGYGDDYYEYCRKAIIVREISYRGIHERPLAPAEMNARNDCDRYVPALVGERRHPPVTGWLTD